MGIIAVLFVSIITISFYFHAQADRQARRKTYGLVVREISDASNYRPPARPAKNLSGLSIACVIVGRTQSGIIFPCAEHTEKLCHRVSCRGGHALKIPDTIALAMACGEDVVMPPGVDLCVLMIAGEERVQAPLLGTTLEFKMWVRAEYPKAVGRSGSFSSSSLMLHYVVVMAVVYQRYEQTTGRKPYPLISTIAGHVLYRDGTGRGSIGSRGFTSDETCSVGWGASAFWDRVIEDSIEGVRMRSRRGTTHVCCPGGSYHDIGRYVPREKSIRRIIMTALGRLRLVPRRIASHSCSAPSD